MHRPTEVGSCSIL